MNRRVAEPRARFEPQPIVVDPFGIAELPEDAPADAPAFGADGSGVGLPLDQVRAWLEQVQEDLRRIQTRLAYLEAEQTRLQEQHHIVAELLTSSIPG